MREGRGEIYHIDEDDEGRVVLHSRAILLNLIGHAKENIRTQTHKVDPLLERRRRRKRRRGWRGRRGRGEGGEAGKKKNEGGKAGGKRRKGEEIEKRGR